MSAGAIRRWLRTAEGQWRPVGFDGRPAEEWAREGDVLVLRAQAETRRTPQRRRPVYVPVRFLVLRVIEQADGALVAEVIIEFPAAIRREGAA